MRKEKEKELERVKKEVAEELYKMIGKYRFNEIEKEAVSIAITSMFKDKQEGREGVIREIKDYQNPYPKDVFTWDNKTDMKITRGRFNEFIHLVVENVKHDLVRDLKEWEGFKHDL